VSRCQLLPASVVRAKSVRRELPEPEEERRNQTLALTNWMLQHGESE
jgi:hypothetical protein